MVCKKVGLLQVEAAKGICIREAWAQSGVFSSGAHRQNQLTSIRRKIYDHKNSTCHIKAEKDRLGQMIDMQNADRVTSTSKLMRTACYNAKSNQPYVAYHELCDLQQANGLDIGVGLHSR